MNKTQGSAQSDPFDFSSRKRGSKYLQTSPLSKDQILLWIFASLEQSYQLARDSISLHKRGRHASAFGILLLAMEESAKPNILIEYMAAGEQKQEHWDRARKKLLSHEAKLEIAFRSLIKITEQDPDSHARLRKKFSGLTINLISGLANAREAALYTSAYEGGVLSPKRINRIVKDFAPIYAPILARRQRFWMRELRANFPGLELSMKRLFHAESDRQYSSRENIFKVEAEKVIFTLRFLKTYFKEWPKVAAELWNEKKFVRVVPLFYPESERRKYNLMFELLNKTSALTDQQKLKVLLHPKVSQMAVEAFAEAKKRDALLRP